MTRPMVIVQLGQGESPHVTRLADSLSRRGHQLHVVSESKFAPFPDIAGVTFHTYPSEGNFVAKVRALKKIISSIGPDVVHSHAVNHGGYVGVASGFHPHVMAAWGSDILVYPKRSAIHRLQTAVALRAADHVLSDAANVRDTIRQIAGELTHNELLFTGVDTRHFSPQPGDAFRKKIGLTDEPLILSTRIMTQFYNQDKMVLALPAVLKRFPDAKLGLLRFLPDPLFETRLRKMVEDLNLTKSVIWLERFQYAELPAAYCAADVVLSVPISDGTPLTVLEALACGKIVVASDLPALREWISHGENGFLAAPEEPDPIASALIGALSLSAETRRQWGVAGREAVLKRGDRDVFLNRLESIYADAISNAKPGMLQTFRNVLGF